MVKWCVVKNKYIASIFLLLWCLSITALGASSANATDEPDIFVTTAPENGIGDEIAPAIPPALIALEKRIAECAVLEDRILRLKCYDDASVANGFMSSDRLEDERETLGKYGFWHVSKRRDASGENHIYLKLPAEQQVETLTGLKKTPEFIIKCRTQNTEAYLDWKGPMVGNRYYLKGFYIVIRIDHNDEVHTDWELSADKFAAFYPQPIEFIRELKKAKKLTLRLNPQNDTVRVLTFKLDGIEEALDVVVKNCYN